jgi:hypothetical protein
MASDRQPVFSTKEIAMPRFNDAIAPQRQKAVLRISFDQRHKVTPDRVFKAIAEALRPTGCPACGLAGIDLILREDLVLPAGEGVQAVLEGSLGG